MFHPDQINHTARVDAPAGARTAVVHGGCLVDGCPCKDARIVSHRRAAFIATLARRNGETADRTVAVDPDWALAGIALA